MEKADRKDKLSEFFALIELGEVDDIKPILKELGDEIVNEYNGFQKTPLMLAAYYGKQEIVNLLLLKGADVDAVDADGRAASNYLENFGEVNNFEKVRMSFKEAEMKVGIDEAKKDSNNNSVQTKKIRPDVI